MSQIFWDTFYANICSSLAVIAILAIAGYIVKHRLTRNLKRFIATEVDETVRQIKNTGK